MKRKPKGSPPRVRGTVRGIVILPLPARITPACAGNSFAGKDTNAKGKDHPRVCGEQHYRIGENWDSDGSPPRVRGTGTISLAS